jgi:outer membrane protein OmpA-like peptidoglycan-associated protein
MIMGRHEGGPRRIIRGIITGLSITGILVLAGFGILALIPSGVEPQASSPITSPPTVFTQAPTTSHEDHVALAHEISPGQAAFDANSQVQRDRDIAAGNPAARATQERLDQAMGGPIMFGPDTAMLTPYGETQVQRIVDVLRADPAARVEVVGSTAVEIADPPLCLQLSRLRAEQVAIRMEMAGIEPSRVSAIGISHSDPRDTAADSRRAEVLALAG